ncbi:PS-10 peptidase S37 [Streptomyces sp. 1114.5]|uniref:S28 family serine protease n=1 Tax=Streptomyces sp. 1114.5 TaxID=1938830 RepID=UPI000EABE290|nr:S28 family serine protease [Streptomyces sp. 1114.5]RKT09619.1 PS-10 peptidase S37 [Streptomyces sp. 1114.5]
MMRTRIGRLVAQAAAVVVLAGTAVMPAAAAAQAGPTGPADIRAAIEAVPGLRIVEEKPAAPGFRFFVLTLHQPADHRHPEQGGFEQRLTLLHRGTDRPTVLYTSGYGLSTGQYRSEPAELVDGNQVSTEQRFFGTSRPEPADWNDLDIRQAAADHHHVIEALKAVYRAPWISTGGSKGGMTTVYHRRFYPRDVAGSIAYSAPNNIDDREDAAYLAFLRTVGTPECRTALQAAQRALLERRTALVARYQAWADARGDGFRLVGSADKAFEIAVLRAPFMFWQGRGQAACPAVPAPDASDDTLYGWLSEVAQLPVYADSVANQFVPYFYQLGTQLGYFQVDTDHLADLVRYPGATEPRTFVPRDVPLHYRPQAMRDVDRWVRTHGEHLMFVNGAADPSVAEPFRLGDGSRDSCLYQVPGGTHAARIAQLPTADATAATATLRRWAGV